MYYFIQYFERHCLSLSECYKLWLSEAGMLQFKEEEVEIWYGTGAVRTNGLNFFCRMKFEIDAIEIKMIN